MVAAQFVTDYCAVSGFPLAEVEADLRYPPLLHEISFFPSFEPFDRVMRVADETAVYLVEKGSSVVCDVKLDQGRIGHA